MCVAVLFVFRFIFFLLDDFFLNFLVIQQKKKLLPYLIWDCNWAYATCFYVFAVVVWAWAWKSDEIFCFCVLNKKWNKQIKIKTHTILLTFCSFVSKCYLFIYLFGYLYFQCCLFFFFWGWVHLARFSSFRLCHSLFSLSISPSIDVFLCLPFSLILPLCLLSLPYFYLYISNTKLLSISFSFRCVFVCVYCYVLLAPIYTNSVLWLLFRFEIPKDYMCLSAIAHIMIITILFSARVHETLECEKCILLFKNVNQAAFCFPSISKSLSHSVFQFPFMYVFTITWASFHCLLLLFSRFIHIVTVVFFRFFF